MKQRTTINEIFFLRAFACLTVVFIHSITMTLATAELALTTQKTLRMFQLLLMFATPLFVFISEFILAHTYSDHVPKGFFSKRIKFIFLPFVFVGIFYAFVSYYNSDLSIQYFLYGIKKNVLTAGYHGYFVIIIFQFYLLHVFGRKLLNRFNPFLMIFLSLIINFSFLYAVNFIDPPAIPNAEFYWYEFSRLLFPGWLFYFTVAYYAGKNYSVFKSWLQNHKGYVFVFYILTASTLFYTYYAGIMMVPSSKRVDIILYTASVFFLLFYIATKITKVSPTIITISQYSFGIYLLHPFFQGLIKNIYLGQDYRNFVLFTIATFVGSLIACIFTTYLLNQVSIGKYLIGKVPKQFPSFRWTAKKKTQDTAASA